MTAELCYSDAQFLISPLTRYDLIQVSSLLAFIAEDLCGFFLT